ncbi:MAG: hypothetical protein ABIW49_03805 [Knoellia sp.]
MGETKTFMVDVDALPVPVAAGQGLHDRASGAGSVRPARRHHDQAVAGTPDPKLFRTQRKGAMTYAFDAAPAGTYKLEFGFA